MLTSRIDESLECLGGTRSVDKVIHVPDVEQAVVHNRQPLPGGEIAPLLIDFGEPTFTLLVVRLIRKPAVCVQLQGVI